MADVMFTDESGKTVGSGMTVVPTATLQSLIANNGFVSGNPNITNQSGVVNEIAQVERNTGVAGNVRITPVTNNNIDTNPDFSGTYLNSTLSPIYLLLTVNKLLQLEFANLHPTFTQKIEWDTANNYYSQTPYGLLAGQADGANFARFLYYATRSAFRLANIRLQSSNSATLAAKSIYKAAISGNTYSESAIRVSNFVQPNSFNTNIVNVPINIEFGNDMMIWMPVAAGETLTITLNPDSL